MQPVSAVNEANYHLLGNQLKGESHASRMRRVNAMQRGVTDPTLQPLGSVSKMGFTVAQGLTSPILLAGLAGAVVGAMNTKPTGRPGSIKDGKEGARRAAVYGAGAVGLSYLVTGGLATASGKDFFDFLSTGISSGSSDEIVAALLAIGAGAAVAYFTHGIGRSARHNLKLS